MSRRFGRNQKRALQEKLRVEKLKVCDINRKVADITHAWEQLREVIRTTLDSRSLISCIAEGRVRQVGRVPDALPYFVRTGNDVQELHRLLFTYRELFNQQLVVETRFKDHVRQLMMTPDAFLAAPDDWLIYMMSDMIHQLKHRAKSSGANHVKTR